MNTELMVKGLLRCTPACLVTMMDRADKPSKPSTRIVQARQRSAASAASVASVARAEEAYDLRCAVPSRLLRSWFGRGRSGGVA